MKNMSYILLLFLICISAALVSIRESNIGIFLFCIFFYFLGIGFLKIHSPRSKNQIFVFKIFTIAYVIYVLNAIFIFYMFIYYYKIPFFGLDDFEYHKWGKIFQNYINLGNFDALFNAFIDKPGYEPAYYYVNGFLYWLADLVGEDHPLIVRFFNCLSGALIPPFLYMIAIRIYNTKIAKTASYLCLFFPQVLYYSGIQHKEIIIAILVLLLIYYSITYVENKKLRYFFFVLVLLKVLMYLRHFYSLVLGSILILYIILSIKIKVLKLF